MEVSSRSRKPTTYIIPVCCRYGFVPNNANAVGKLSAGHFPRYHDRS